MGFSTGSRNPLPTRRFFFFNDTATTEIYTLSLHDALPIWRDRKANADVDLDRPRTNGDRLPKRVGRASGDLYALLFRGIRKQDRKFVASKPRDRIAFSGKQGQSPGHFSQYLIAWCMTKRVVDVLEMVEIEHENDKLLMPASCPLECVIETIAEEHTIGQVGERVVHGLVPQTPLSVITRLFGE